MKFSRNGCTVKLPEGLLLLDSGAQYQDGTTDITSTIAPLGPVHRGNETYLYPGSQGTHSAGIGKVP